MSIILKGRNIEGGSQCLEASHAPRPFTPDAQSHSARGRVTNGYNLARVASRAGRRDANTHSWCRRCDIDRLVFWSGSLRKTQGTAAFVPLSLLRLADERTPFKFKAPTY
jgi:hypothetical protein